MEKKSSIDKGFIKLYRSIENNKFYFAEPFTYMGAWIDLLLLANHQDRTFNVRGNFVTAKRGEVGYSRESLAKRWKWSRGKVNRFLDKLEMEQQIVQQKSHILSIIQINNYDKFQTNRTTDSTTDGQQTVQQTDTNKNDKKEKNVKKEITSKSYDNHKIIHMDNDNDNDNDNDSVNVFNETINNFKVMRKQLKKPLTEHGEKLLLKELEKLAKTEEEKIAILNQSILNSWQGVFALKKEGYVENVRANRVF